MTMKHITPPGIRPPFARYSYGVEIPPGHRILVCSGQLGVAPDDQIPTSVEEQTNLCFRNIGTVLTEAGLAFCDVVRVIGPQSKAAIERRATAPSC